MSRMKQAMHTAMRFAVYIRSLGEEPRPFQHRTLRSYAVALQRQYDELLRVVDPATVRQAKAAGRALIRQQTLPVAAGDLFSAPPIQRMTTRPPVKPKCSGSLLEHSNKQSGDASAGPVSTEGLHQAAEGPTRDALVPIVAPTPANPRSEIKKKRERLETLFQEYGHLVPKCPRCRMRCGLPKKSWPNREMAEESRSRSPDATALRVYECPHQPGYWHVGHNRFWRARKRKPADEVSVAENFSAGHIGDAPVSIAL